MRAFSLVELSIVLVILGLLTGGILAGQSLIRAAELRAIPSELNRYVTATQIFRDKYMALPGDMPNAVRFWGAQAGGTTDGVDATCAALTHTSPATGPATCNGNGNGIVSNSEAFRYWHHLANAGLIEGTYAGVGGPAGNFHARTGWNVPASRVSNVGWSLGHLSNYGGSTQAFAFDYGHTYEIGTEVSSNNRTYGPFLTPEEMWSLDAKIDDGKPGQGSIIVYYWPSCTNAANQTDTAASYVFTNTGRVCRPYYAKAF